MRFCARVWRWPPWAAGPVGGLKGLDAIEGDGAGVSLDENDARGPVGTLLGPVGGVAGDAAGAGANGAREAGVPHPPRPRELKLLPLGGP